jgi:hypothetical protein
MLAIHTLDQIKTSEKRQMLNGTMKTGEANVTLLYDLQRAPFSQQCCMESPHTTKKTKKRVRWNDSPEDDASSRLDLQNQSYLLMTTEDIQNKWYRRSELASAKIITHDLATEIRKRERCKENGYDSLLAHVYKSCHEEEPNAISNACFGQLVKWMRKCPSHRGIEHLIVPKIGETMREKRVSLIKSVVLLQTNTSHRLGSENLSEILSTRSKEMSQFSRKFARIMGQADACELLSSRKKQRLG